MKGPLWTAALIYNYKRVNKNSIKHHKHFLPQVVENYVKDFWRTYKDKPKFVFTLQGTYSHSDLNLLDLVDDELHEFLLWMNSPSVQNNTMLVIMGDHGPRGHELTFTRQGSLELKRPFMYVALPKWVQEAWPEAYGNLKNNSKRLVTTMDLHYTFKNLLDFVGADFEVRVHQLNIFKIQEGDGFLKICLTVSLTLYWSENRYHQQSSNYLVRNNFIRALLRKRSSGHLDILRNAKIQ